jgi:SOS-response transcriptional repressor LexA
MNASIRHRRQTLNLSLQKLADRVGTSKGQIDKLEKGQRRLTVDWLQRLAEALHCSPVDLLTGIPPEAAESSLLPETMPETGVETGAEAPTPTAPNPTQPLPLWSGDTAKAWVQRPPQLNHNPQAFAMRVADNSLSPGLVAGDLLYVDPGQPPLPGRLVVVRWQQALLIKRVEQNDGQQLVAAFSPERPTIPLAELEVVGLVVGWWVG